MTKVTTVDLSTMDDNSPEAFYNWKEMPSNVLNRWKNTIQIFTENGFIWRIFVFTKKMEMLEKTEEKEETRNEEEKIRRTPKIKMNNFIEYNHVIEINGLAFKMKKKSPEMQHLFWI